MRYSYHSLRVSESDLLETTNHKCSNPERNVTDKLNRLGKHGWEAYAITQLPHTSYIIFHLRKEFSSP